MFGMRKMKNNMFSNRFLTSWGKYAMQQFSNTMSKIYKEKNLKMGVFETEEQAYEWFVKNGN